MLLRWARWYEARRGATARAGDAGMARAVRGGVADVWAGGARARQYGSGVGTSMLERHGRCAGIGARQQERARLGHSEVDASEIGTGGAGEDEVFMVAPT